jgi:hypothetical protein
MKLRIRITKRGVAWSCCVKWRIGAKCACSPYIVEFFDELMLERARVRVAGEGPRVSHGNT